MNEQSHAKLGAFLLLGFGLLLLCLLFYISKLRDRPSLDYVTYFDQPVNGLKEGAPVRFRGVEVGKVDYIALAPENTWIEVGILIYMDILDDLGADMDEVLKLHQQRTEVNELFRVRLESNLVTGLAFLQVDTAPSGDVAVLEPSFPLPRKYVYSMPTMTTSMIDSLSESLEKLPKVLDGMDGLIAHLDQAVSDAEVAEVRSEVTALMADVRSQMEHARLPQMLVELRQLTPQFAALLGDLRRLVGQLEEQPESLIYGPRTEKD